MKNLILIMMVILLSCKKDEVEPFNAKNKLEATITFTSGEVRQFSASGPSVKFACGFASGSYVEANESPEPVYSPTLISLSVQNGSFNCITGPGTYPLSVYYDTNKKSQATPIFRSLYSKNWGTITYTFFDGKYAQGYFEAEYVGSWDTNDSISVKGTFSGYLK